MNIVIIGGGTGTSVVARALKKYWHFNIAVIVSVFDSGGSAGLVLDEHGALPASDAIQAVLALMPEGGDLWEQNLETLRTMLSFRFEDEPPVAGRRLGSYMMVALERTFGFDEAILRLCRLYQTVGSVIPVATKVSNLVAHYSNGREVEKEVNIDSPIYEWQKQYEITDLRIEPEVYINERARGAINDADYLIYGPGDLFTSILPNLVVNGFTEAVSKSRAKILYCVNIMTKPGQTGDFSASRHVEVLEDYLNRPVDTVLMPTGIDALPHKILKRYADEGAHPVVDDLLDSLGVIRADVLSREIYTQSASDRVMRSLVRHDVSLLGEVLAKILI